MLPRVEAVKRQIDERCKKINYITVVVIKIKKHFMKVIITCEPHKCDRDTYDNLIHADFLCYNMGLC